MPSGCAPILTSFISITTSSRAWRVTKMAVAVDRTCVMDSIHVGNNVLA
jgi:hypothetical protein